MSRPVVRSALLVAAALALLRLVAGASASATAAVPLQDATATAAATSTDGTPQPTSTPIPVGGRLAAKNACYVRLPDMPVTPGLYGGFGAYNAATGVLGYAGGAERETDALTTTHHDLYAIRLDGADAWKAINYPATVGYNRDNDRGCREMASVKLSDTNWLSVLGKDGCDKGRFDAGKQKGGDLVELQVGASADAAGVKWVSNSGATELTGPLLDGEGKLVRLFGTYDAQRKRVIFGQGTFDNDVDASSQDRIYAATKAGSQWRITDLHPTGQAPVARYGTCAAYVNDLDNGLDGVLVVGGQQGGAADPTSYNEVWWLDFGARAAGEWRNITGRFTNEADFGPRREGACAYDAKSRTFYSWMGRASKDIPGGAKHSSGAWRVDLSALGTEAPLTWERLAKDDLKGVRGRSLLPSVWDPVNKRLFALGGRNDLDEFAEVWAIYPDVTGAECDDLDPFAPFRAGPTATRRPTSTATVAAATGSPSPTATPSPPPTAIATPTVEATPPPPGTPSPRPTDAATPTSTPPGAERATVYLPWAGR